MTVPAMFDLSGRVAIVAGATRGIGGAFARQYIAHGGRVTVAARDAAACAALASELNDRAGGEVAWGYASDLADPASIDVLIDASAAYWGRLDTLFCSSYFAFGEPASATPTRISSRRCG